jgi:dsRNA-specific ribonuclease
MVATMMEAIIGAVYLDDDMKAVKQLMVDLGGCGFGKWGS